MLKSILKHNKSSVWPDLQTRWGTCESNNNQRLSCFFDFEKKENKITTTKSLILAQDER